MQIQNFYKKIFDISEPYNFQYTVWEKVEKLIFPFLIKAPTGSGKTESILAPFLNQFIENKFKIASKLIYVLPVRVLVNSLTERVKRYLQRISSNIILKIQHGDLPNSPFFIGDIIITTLDQFFYGLTRSSKQAGRHIDLPAGSIASSLVVFDEAHMYRDEFTFSIMRAILEISYHSRVPFVFMTATLPKSLEESIFENIELSDKNKIVADLSVSGKIDTYIVDEPMIVEDGLNEKIIEKIKNKRALIVCNQVKRAQNVYDKLKEIFKNKELILLHSRFTKTDRKKHEEKALSVIPHSENGEIKFSENTGIVISTQVLEAGIDFSAEVLITEIAPSDSLIQRIGRCARYKGEIGEVLIFSLPDEEKKYLPYKKENVEKAYQELRNNGKINLKDYKQVCEFIDKTLDYKANDFEAKDTLVDLYECVLYADTEPSNIQVRKSKPATLLVVDFSLGIKEGKRQKEEDIIKNAVLKTDYRENCIDVDIKVVWKLFKEKKVRWMLDWKEEDGKRRLYLKNLLEKRQQVSDEDSRILPFKIYVLNKKEHYDELKGIKNDECAII